MKDFVIQTVFNQAIKESEIKLVSGQNPLKGVDNEYDLLLQALGSVAKHNPKLVIDSVMIWRKSHSSTSQAITVILIRILVEIVIHCNMALHPELSFKLEEMTFNQILSNGNDFFLFSELLGHLSIGRFDSIKRKYISLIDSNISNESQLEILLKSMRFIRLRLYPEKELDETVDYIRYLADFYRDTLSSNLKTIYSELLIFLLTPLSPIVMAEVNIPDWMKACDSIYQKSQRAMTKGRAHGYLLATTILCISRRDFFLQKWVPLLETMFQRLKDKTLRSNLLICLSRLIWTYLYRCAETITTTHQKLDQIVKVLFPGKKVYPSEVSLDSFIWIIQYILGKHWEYGLKLIWNLLNGDSPLTSIDQVSPERVSICVKAFVGYLSSPMATNPHSAPKPPFPWDAEALPSGMEFPQEELFCYFNSNPKNAHENLFNTEKYAQYSDVISKVNGVLGKILKLVDQNFGSHLLTCGTFSLAISYFIK